MLWAKGRLAQLVQIRHRQYHRPEAHGGEVAVDLVDNLVAFIMVNVQHQLV